VRDDMPVGGTGAALRLVMAIGEEIVGSDEPPLPRGDKSNDGDPACSGNEGSGNQHMQSNGQCDLALHAPPQRRRDIIASQQVFQSPIHLAAKEGGEGRVLHHNSHTRALDGSGYILTRPPHNTRRHTTDTNIHTTHTQTHNTSYTHAGTNTHARA